MRKKIITNSIRRWYWDREIERITTRIKYHLGQRAQHDVAAEMLFDQLAAARLRRHRVT